MKENIKLKKKLNFITDDNIHSSITDLKSFFFLLKMSRPYLLNIFMAFGLIIFSSLTTLYAARLMGQLVQDGLITQKWFLSAKICLVILALESISIYSLWRGRIMLSKVAVNTVFIIRKNLFDHLKRISLLYYDRQPQGRIMTRLTHDVEGIEDFFSSSLGRLASSIILFSMALVAMILTDIKLGPLMIVMVIPIVLLTWLSRASIKMMNREISKGNSSCNSKLAEYLQGIAIIKHFGLENWAYGNYKNEVDQLLNTNYSANLLYGWIRPLTNFLCTFPLIFLIWYGGYAVYLGNLEIGIFIAFIRYCERFTGPIVTLAREFHFIQQALASSERITSFLKSPIDRPILNSKEKVKLPKIKGDIVFSHVSMSYGEGPQVLKDISFDIRAGQKVGLVGKTGSGKTTTVSLLTKLYSFQEGEIYLDGISLNDLTPDQVRGQIGIVSQESILFNGTLRENLSCRRNIPDQIIYQAASETGLLEVMKRSYLTLDTPILDNGTNLGLGQAQLISITRTFLSRPNILILDEATAHIDRGLEVIIQKAIAKLVENKTCITIAHRIQTIKDCDYIIVFHNGYIIEKGTPKQLINKNGTFSQLYQNSINPLDPFYNHLEGKNSIKVA